MKAINYFKYGFWCKPEEELLIRTQIEKNDYVVLGLSWCPWTKRMLTDLKQEGAIPVVLVPDVVSHNYKVEFYRCVQKVAGTIKAPVLFHKGKKVGDYYEYEKWKERVVSQKESDIV